MSDASTVGNSDDTTMSQSLIATCSKDLHVEASCTIQEGKIW